MKEYYLNRETGEITESHKQAMEWFNAGAEIEVWKKGKMVVFWCR